MLQLLDVLEAAFIACGLFLFLATLLYMFNMAGHLDELRRKGRWMLMLQIGVGQLVMCLFFLAWVFLAMDRAGISLVVGADALMRIFMLR